jgi:hypothetical protein
VACAFCFFRPLVGGKNCQPVLKWGRCSPIRVPFSPPINDQNQIALGGRLTWNFSKHFGLDGEMDASPVRTSNLTTAYQGGHLLKSFFGIKAGRRWDRFGMFGKFRPGRSSYSRVITNISQSSFQFGRRTDPACDVGVITEFYVSRRILSEVRLRRHNNPLQFGFGRRHSCPRCHKEQLAIFNEPCISLSLNRRFEWKSAGRGE